MGSQRIEIHIETITREDWETARSQDLSQGVNDPMRRVLRARTQKEHRKNLGAGVDGQPEPEHLCGAAQPGAEFIQLQMREVQGAEIVFVQRLSMLPSVPTSCATRYLL
jgi:hypothetical protein